MPELLCLIYSFGAEHPKLRPIFYYKPFFIAFNFRRERPTSLVLIKICSVDFCVNFYLIFLIQINIQKLKHTNTIIAYRCLWHNLRSQTFHNLQNIRFTLWLILSKNRPLECNAILKINTTTIDLHAVRQQLIKIWGSSLHKTLRGQNHRNTFFDFLSQSTVYPRAG